MANGTCKIANSYVVIPPEQNANFTFLISFFRFGTVLTIERLSNLKSRFNNFLDFIVAAPKIIFIFRDFHSAGDFWFF